MAGVTSSADAVALELDAQQWSIGQPAFHEAVAKARAHLCDRPQ
jgi:hypothetical protein